MAKLVEYDISGVEESGGGGSEEPRPAVYPAVIRVCERRTQKNDGTPIDDMRVGLDLGGDYRWLWTYIGFGEASEWKLAEFIRAVGLKERGKFDPDKMKGKMIRVKVNPGTYEGAYRADAGRLMKALPDDELPEASANGASASADDGPDEDDYTDAETDVQGAADFIPSREGEEFGSYEDWEEADLEEEVADRGLKIPSGRGKKTDKLIKVLRADDEKAAAEPGDDDSSEPSGEATDDYDTWEVELLEAEFKDRELKLPSKPRGRNAADRYQAALIAALREDDEANPFPEED